MTADWLTWPPARELEPGREYLVRTRTGQQRIDRESRMSFLGEGLGALQFNARPAGGTQSIDARSIVATRDLGPSIGREDARRYCYQRVTS